MLKTAEAVSIGHPDKTADYISSYILDRFIEQDSSVRYAVEVMVKNNTVVLGGEIAGRIDLSNLSDYVMDALRDIGYDERYADIWQDKAINIKQLKIVNLIGIQSPDIARGIYQDGWGDQGVFVGYACPGEDHINRELYLAKKLNKTLYNLARQSDYLGIDIKTQITVDEGGHVTTAIVAVPMLEPQDLTDCIISVLGDKPDQIIINGTGIYQIHSSVADCGITGRKLACDFYATACPIGGGSPWTKDAGKADLTLNLYARYLALRYLKGNDECFVYLSSCIGRADLPNARIVTVKQGHILSWDIDIHQTPREIIRLLELDKPVFADMCRNGFVESVLRFE
ncbi:MAG: methionine adenosyltransferase domain-containing protein [Alphaproteobacteria bacterium]|nr:methionine adenosyltransferase domain-containing protein [Alphaproteobacteria bacterium]